MATLDTSYYQGTDRYSDGDETENRILGIVRQGKTFQELEREEISWPLLYHLSPIRENICNWYPFRKGSRILEIGAGCGAITGALCRSGADVYCVDLSLRRSTINYERHQAYPNLRLYTGNLHDISFKEPFDYVTVNGVLEYAGQFSEGERPYRVFLDQVRKYLKPEGRMLLAIENRFGLKYLAGAPEDHLGKPYAGLRGYHPEDGVRTFSRSELIRLLEESGFRDLRFYYPYPDYKFPAEIFTEELLKNGRYGKPYLVYDRDWTLLFPEEPVASLLAEDGAIGALANSFLVEASAQPMNDEERTLYVKLNNDRRDAFRIGTRILEKDGKREAEKFALTEKAKEHLHTILANEKRMAAICPVAVGRETDERIRYPFFSAVTLEDVLKEAVRRQDAEEIIAVFTRIRDLICARAEDAAYGTPGFQEWFGTEQTTELRMICVNPANVDLMPDNIFQDGEKLLVTDCEWVTDFPVPVAFLLWRSADRTYALIPGLEDIICREELFRRIGIQETDLPAFRAWTWHFENEYVAPKSAGCFGRDVIHTDQDVGALLREKHALEQQLREILDSRSWRMMAYPRKLYRKLFRKGMNGAKQ